MKYALIQLIRSAGLLKLADQVKYLMGRLKNAPGNRAFRRAHPDFPTPPPALAFDAYNHVDWNAYHDGGLAHAEVFAAIVREGAGPGPLAVLEWGCGPARIIRHLPRLLAGYALRLVGSDYNPDSIAWCEANIPGVEFVLNGLNPPLPFADASFDVVYNFSVFTHLSEAVQKAWTAELFRVLKPGGRLICTTHGDHYRYLLARKDDLARYDAGQVVTQEGYDEGKKWFFAIHPPAMVEQDLLKAFERVRRAQPAAEHGLFQDVWVATKPAGAETGVA